MGKEQYRCARCEADFGISDGGTRIVSPTETRAFCTNCGLPVGVEVPPGSYIVSVGYPEVPRWKLWLARILGERTIGHDEDDEVLTVYRWRGRLYVYPSPTDQQSQPARQRHPDAAERPKDTSTVDALQSST